MNATVLDAALLQAPNSYWKNRFLAYFFRGKIGHLTAKTFEWQDLDRSRLSLPKGLSMQARLMSIGLSIAALYYLKILTRSFINLPLLISSVVAFLKVLKD